MTGYRQAQAVILRHQDHREGDRRLTLLTPTGRVAARAPGARKAKSRLGGILQPATLVEITLYERPGALATITGAQEIASFRRLHEDLGRLAAAQVLLEICDVPAGEQEAVRPFVALVQALRALDGEEEPGAALLAGELSLLAAYGWGLALDRCTSCGGALAPPLRYPVEEGGFACGRCATGGVEASGEALSALRSAAAGEPPRAAVREARALLHLTWQAHRGSPLRAASFAESVLGQPEEHA